MPKTQSDTLAKVSCYHCGEDCPTQPILQEDKTFCCEGCRTVYDILATNEMCQYYQLGSAPGQNQRKFSPKKFEWLDDAKVVQQLLDFNSEKLAKVSFDVPQMHCTSCIWLLENLYQLEEGVLNTRVNFLNKKLFVSYNPQLLSLRDLVTLLATIGYEPDLKLDKLEKERDRIADRRLYYQLGLAGFAFGNIMLFSFPEYLGLTDVWTKHLFSWLNVILSLPVIFYSAQDYLKSALNSLRIGRLNIDIPISLGIFTLFSRSLFEIVNHLGPGYLDSLAGLVFFLLIGKWFQQKTYAHLSFDRNYKSYFPIAANRLDGNKEVSVALDQLSAGDTIYIRHGELIPADGLLVNGEARIDYSFVTGEKDPVEVNAKAQIYAGGRQVGGAIEVLLTKKVAQSYLTQLWNDEAFQKNTSNQASKLADEVGKYFTVSILAIAAVTLIYWWNKDIGMAVNAFTAVLIIACPCALALSVPFTLGNALRILARKGFYLKNTQVIEHLARIKAVIFDKTGTLTTNQSRRVTFKGDLSDEEMATLKTIANFSAHPLSRLIVAFLEGELAGTSFDVSEIEHFEEVTGKGLLARVGGNIYQLGSAAWLSEGETKVTAGEGQVLIRIGDKTRGYFKIEHQYRNGLGEVLDFFKGRGETYLLSGDNDRESDYLAPYFGGKENLHFSQSPQDKLGFIRQLQQNEGRGNVMMIGDGLNDAGALKQSDVGMVLAEDANHFTPASDAILSAQNFELLPQLIRYARGSVRLVYAAYGLAFLYNIVGLSFAVQGALSPVIAAILMPLSSVTIAIFGLISSGVLARGLWVRKVTPIHDLTQF